MSKPVDDLDAVRQISEVLSAFDDEDDRKRILRWACEKTNTDVEFAPPLPAVAATPPPSGAPAVPGGVIDIKTFVESKQPASDMHFAATVAYYYQFVALENRRRTVITPEDLVEACRLANRNRPPKPYNTLHNAMMAGLLDRGQEPKSFKISTVGENLVQPIGNSFRIRDQRAPREKYRPGGRATP